LFSEWVKGIDLDQLSWRPVAAALHASFGRDRVELIDFRIVKQGDEAFVRHVLNRVDPTLKVPMGELREAQNRSISAQGLDMALAVNPLLRSPAERHALRGFLQKHFSNVDSPRPALFDPAEKARVWDQYRAEYDELVAVS
jgi:hypothetical protein